MSVPQVDFDLSQTLQAKNPQAIAFSCKDSGADAGEQAPTLRAMGHAGSHANAGGQVAVAFAQNQVGEVRTSLNTLNTNSNPSGRNTPMVAINTGRGFFRESEAAATLGTAPRSVHEGNLVRQMQVRRLTPRECERLQGFPDDYTLIPWKSHQSWAKRKGTASTGETFDEFLRRTTGRGLREPTTEDCPDGPRYKALGNSWAIPVVRWIGQRIALLDGFAP